MLAFLALLGTPYIYDISSLRVNSLDKRIAENIIGFLTRFKDTTMAPTFHATKLRGLKLLSSLETKPGNSEFVRNFKIKGKPIVMKNGKTSLHTKQLHWCT